MWCFRWAGIFHYPASWWGPSQVRLPHPNQQDVTTVTGCVSMPTIDAAQHCVQQNGCWLFQVINDLSVIYFMCMRYEVICMKHNLHFDWVALSLQNVLYFKPQFTCFEPHVFNFLCYWSKITITIIIHNFIQLYINWYMLSSWTMFKLQIKCKNVFIESKIELLITMVCKHLIYFHYSVFIWL